MPRTSRKCRKLGVSQRFLVASLPLTLAGGVLIVHRAQADNTPTPGSQESAGTASTTVESKRRAATPWRSDPLVNRLLDGLGQHRPEALSSFRPAHAGRPLRVFSYAAEKNWADFLHASVLELTRALQASKDAAERADYLLVRERFQWFLDAQVHGDSGTRIDMTDPMALILSAVGPSLRESVHAQNPHADNDQQTHLQIATELKTLAMGSPSSQGVHIFYQDKMKRVLTENPGRKIQFPRKSLCNKVITNQHSALEWLKDRLKKTTSPDLKTTLMVLEREVESYTTYVRNHILPRCTELDQSRRQTYVEGLRSRSILFSPEQIFASAQKWVKALEAQAKETIEKIPTLRSKEKDPFPVASAFHALSAASFPDGQPSLPTYRKAASRILSLSQPEGLSISENVKNKILDSLKESDVLDVTFAAEWAGQDAPRTAAVLVPRIRRPFRQLQDFVFPAAASMAAAREIYPGKAFLFHQMFRRSTSTARSFFAQRSRILEGWGLWALQKTLDQLDPEERLIGLIYLLYQAQRALHESAIALGQSSERELSQNLLRSLGMSAPTAQSNANMVDAAPGLASEPFAYWLALQQALQPSPECALRTYLEDPHFPYWLSANLLSRTCPVANTP